MSMTRGQILDRVAKMLGNTGSDMRTFLEVSLENMIFYLYDMHDWEWKHKSSTFNTISGTESYALNTSPQTTTDLRSAQDIEVMWDKTNGLWLRKVDLSEIREMYPKQDVSGKPQFYAPWGPKSIFLHYKPDGVYQINFLYAAKATLPSADANDLEAVCGIPDYVQYLLEKLLLAEGMLYYDDSRYTALTQAIESLWKKRAIEADMKHLENNARFKFWDENLRTRYSNYNDFIAHSIWEDN